MIAGAARTARRREGSASTRRSLPADLACGVGLACGVTLAAGLSVAGCAPTAEGPRIDVAEITIADVHEALLSGRATCREVVQAHLDRIEAYDDRLGAITVVNPRALERADELDALLASAREARAGAVAPSAAEGQAATPPAELGPLFCVPMLVKDNFDTADMVTTGGSIALAGSVPPDDAFMVRRIREAGAIVLAKTNMGEWAFSPRETVSSSFGTTRNAYDLDRVPAGSSGGTASGIAASFGVIGLGTDTGNSIRGPSSHLALVGIRSTLGLTSRDGVIPLSFDRDIAGPMGRTVEDVARVFDVVAGYDPADPYTEGGQGRREPGYAELLDAGALEGARIGVLRTLADPAETDTAIVRLFQAALADLESLGAELVDPFGFDLEAQLEREGMFCRRFRYDMAVYLRSLGEAAPISDVIEVLETGQHSRAAESGLRRFAGYPADVHPAEWSEPCPDFLEHPARQAYLSDLVAAMDGAGVDALAYPTWSCVPAHLQRADEEYCGDNSQLIAPATGTPAVTVPMGFAYGDLPAGLQLLGRPYAEGLLLGLAYAYERGTRHRRPPEGFPALP